MPPLLQAVDNLGTVMGNLLKTQAKLEGLKDKLSALETPEGPGLLDYSLGPLFKKSFTKVNHIYNATST